MNVHPLESRRLMCAPPPVLPGDANRDGRVDLTDFTILAANFNQTDRAWSTGDFSGDGTVDLTDFTILAAHFNIDVNPPPTVTLDVVQPFSNRLVDDLLP